MSNAIEVRNVSQCYNDRQILNDVSLVVPEYSVLGLIGENGAGKTTLIKAILGLVHISSGEIIVNGEKLTGRRGELMKELAFMLEPRYCSYLSPYNMLKYILIVSKQFNKDSKKEITKVLSMLKLDKVAKKSIKTLSFGMKQRVALAMALIRKPSILILDEPLVGLDMQGVELFNDMIKELVDTKKCTIIISSHQLDEIQKISSTIAYIDGGTIKTYDDISSLIDVEYWFSFEKPLIDIPSSLSSVCKFVSCESDNVLHIVSNDDLIFRRVSQAFSYNKIIDMKKSENGLRNLFLEGRDD